MQDDMKVLANFAR